MAAVGGRDADSQDGDDECSITTLEPTSDVEENQSGPASLSAIHPDDDCLSTALFTCERRKQDARLLGADMLSTLLLNSWKVQERHERLYHLARF